MTTIRRIPIRILSNSLFNNYKVNFRRSYCSSESTEHRNVKESSSIVKSGFAKAFERHSKPAENDQPKEDNQTFASLLRNSKFIDMGDPEGKIVHGTIYHVVGDDLYIDFGWKFHCVCQRPNRNWNDYVRGSKVRLRVKDLELSTRFLGSQKDLTILEADCQLIGLLYSPARAGRGETKTRIETEISS